MENNETVSGKIIKVLDRKSKYGKNYFDVLFQMTATGSYLRSCIYTECRNYERWEDLLEVGNVIGGLELIYIEKRLFVDADSYPFLKEKTKFKSEPEKVHTAPAISKIKSTQEKLF